MGTILIAVVVLFSGNPVKGATVNVCHQAESYESIEGQLTDSRGRYMVEIEPGEHNIAITIKDVGYFTFNKNFTKDKKEVVVELVAK